MFLNHGDLHFGGHIFFILSIWGSRKQPFHCSGMIWLTNKMGILIMGTTLYEETGLLMECFPLCLSVYHWNLLHFHTNHCWNDHIKFTSINVSMMACPPESPSIHPECQALNSGDSTTFLLRELQVVAVVCCCIVHDISIDVKIKWAQQNSLFPWQ